MKLAEKIVRKINRMPESSNFKYQQLVLTSLNTALQQKLLKVILKWTHVR